MTFIKRNIRYLFHKNLLSHFDGSKLGWKCGGTEFLGKVLIHGVFHFANYVMGK